MFCPLCHADYREGFTVCSFCRTKLVPEDASDSERNPPQLAWMTRERREFDRVVAQLRDDDVPCREERQGDHWLYAIAGRRPTFFIFILEPDASKANQAASVEFRPLWGWQAEAKGVPKQTCPACGAEFPAGVGQCPGCKTDLLAWKPPEEPPEGGGFKEEKASGSAEEDGPLEVVWRGGDPVSRSRVCHFTELRSHGLRVGHASPKGANPRPRLRWESRT